MKDDRFRIGLLLSPIANQAKNLPNDLRERGDSSGQAILTFRLRAITAGIQGGLYHLKCLPVTGGGHLRWPWEGPR